MRVRLLGLAATLIVVSRRSGDASWARRVLPALQMG